MKEKEVIEFLDSNKIEYILKPHKEEALTCEKAAKERNVRISQIVKCMIWSDEQENIYVMLIPWDATLKIKKVRHNMWWKLINLIDSSLLENKFSLTVWAISPIQFIWKWKIIIDHTVLNEEIVDISSGNPLIWIELKSQDLLKITNAEKFDIISSNKN